jgi:hypothetical protein
VQIYVIFIEQEKMNKKKIAEWLQNNINRLEDQENLLNEEYLKVLGEIDLNLTKVLFKNILVEFASENGYKIAFAQRILKTDDDIVKFDTFTITPII